MAAHFMPKLSGEACARVAQKQVWMREKTTFVKMEICEPMKGAEMATAAMTATILGTKVRVIS